MTVRDDIRSLFTLPPTPGRRLIAVESAIAMGLPIALFTLVGQALLGILALVGAFSVMYFADRNRRSRAALFPLIALGFVASSVIGVATAQDLVASLIALVVVAAVSAALCFGFRVGPPGALFFVLIAGASSHLAAPVASQGAALAGSLVVGMVAVGCLFAYAVVLVPLLVPAVRRRAASGAGDRKPVAFRLDPISRLMVFRLIIASAIAAVVSAPLGVHRVYWVLVTVVAILQADHHIRLTVLRGVHRVAGTLVGVGLFAIIAVWNPEGLWLAVLVAVLIFLAQLVLLSNYGLGLVLITPLALVIAAQGHSESLISIVGDRIVDTILGGGIALVVLMLSIALRRIRRLRIVPR
jgi:Fusaric acid resistance protein-like